MYFENGRPKPALRAIRFPFVTVAAFAAQADGVGALTALTGDVLIQRAKRRQVATLRRPARSVEDGCSERPGSACVGLAMLRARGWPGSAARSMAPGGADQLAATDLAGAFGVAAPAARPVSPRIRCRKLSSVFTGMTSRIAPKPFSASTKPQIAISR